MPVISNVYSKLNIVIGGEIRGLALAPDHYVITNQRHPISWLAIIIDAPNNKSLFLDDAIEYGLATLMEPFETVSPICAVGDADPVRLIIADAMASGSGRAL